MRTRKFYLIILQLIVFSLCRKRWRLLRKPGRHLQCSRFWCHVFLMMTSTPRIIRDFPPHPRSRPPSSSWPKPIFDLTVFFFCYTPLNGGVYAWTLDPVTRVCGAPAQHLHLPRFVLTVYIPDTHSSFFLSIWSVDAWCGAWYSGSDWQVWGCSPVSLHKQRICSSARRVFFRHTYLVSLFLAVFFFTWLTDAFT